MWRHWSGGEASRDPKYTCCVENALDLREFLEGKECELVVTDDKEGDDCGERPRSRKHRLGTQEAGPC